jgi:ATP-dependent helicase/nuclease subunit A
VQDVVALLDALVSTRHDLSLARALKSPLFGWSDDALAWVARLQQHGTVRPGADAKPVKPSWWTVLQRFSALPSHEKGALPSVPEPLAQAFANTAVQLLRYRQWVQSLPPHDALSAIYGDADVLARFAQAVPASQRAGVLAQLRDLLANALAQDGGRFLTPYRFVRALKAGGIKATPTHNPGAVRLLTIHGAKGLEADTVLLLDTDTGSSRPESMGVLIDWPGESPVPRRFVFLASEKTPPACAASALALEQQARSLEELNALYVALTRAESRLVISSFEPHARGTATTWYERLLPLTQPLEAPPETAGRAPADTSTSDTFSLLALPTFTPVAGTAPAAPVDPVRADDERTRIGLAMHRLLQWHPTPALGFDWSGAHAQAVAREFALSPAQTAQAQAMARRIVQGEAAWAWDGAVVDTTGNEVDIFHAGELLRLDRLVRRADTGEWWVLDFKSAENPEQQLDLLAKMQRYRQAVQSARPGAVVRLAFINLHGRLIELQDPSINP